MQTSSRRVLVTGCSSGFGKLIALRLAKDGHRVFASVRNPAHVERLRHEATQAGVALSIVQLDITDEQSRARAVDALITEAGGIDVLVNNAGRALGGFFEEVELDELRAQFETNFFGTAAMCHRVLPYMRGQGSGRIINISSVAGHVGQPAVSAYCASKFALEGLSESMRHEVLPYGVYVVLVVPGSFRTDIFESNKWVSERARAGDSPYASLAQKIEARVDSMAPKLPHPSAVANAVARAVNARKPAMRYVVGHDARAMSCAKRWMPFGLVEKAVQAALARM